jgi:uncharacterized protein (DUF58 family)
LLLFYKKEELTLKLLNYMSFPAQPGFLPAAQSLAAGLPPLLLAAETLAASMAPGRHGRRRAGTGEQFWQFRDYQNGDEPRRIDWRRSARGTRLYLREREWEAIETLNIEIDRSPGMDWRSVSGLPSKQDRAVLLALALAALALRGGERVTLARRSKPHQGQNAMARLALALDQPPVLPMNGGRLALFGDFLDAPDGIADKLNVLGATARGGVLVHILDPAECEFPYDGRVLFTAGAAPPEDVPRAEAIRAAYRARLASQQAVVAQLAEAAHLVPVFHRTDAPPAPALAAIRSALDLD